MMTEEKQKIWQMIIIFIVVIGLLVWWAAYRLGYIGQPSASQRDQVLNNLQRKNDDFLKMLEDNAKMLASSTQPINTQIAPEETTIPPFLSTTTRP